MRGRKLIVALAGLAVVVAVGAVVLWPQTERITPENCDRIRVGMARAEVEQMLGGPPGYYAAGPLTLPVGFNLEAPWTSPVSGDGALAVGYVGNRGAIAVSYNSSGAVMYKIFLPGERLEQTPLENLLWRAKRQWRRWFPE